MKKYLRYVNVSVAQWKEPRLPILGLTVQIYPVIFLFFKKTMKKVSTSRKEIPTQGKILNQGNVEENLKNKK